MSLDRIALRRDWPDALRQMFPRITLSQIEAFGALIATDRLVDDQAKPTDALVKWCEGVQL
jgi:hypothetical protein